MVDELPPSSNITSRPTTTDDLVRRLVNPDTDSNERKALEAWVGCMIRIFQDDPKNSYILEAAHLSCCTTDEEYSNLLVAFSNVIIQGSRDGDILDPRLLASFIRVLRRAPSTLSAETAKLGSVLHCLEIRLENAVKRAEIETQYQLVYMLSLVLDAMVDIHISGLNREDLHEPLLKQLERLKNHREPRLAQASRYAYQALVGIPDDEGPYQALWRYSCAVIEVAANVSSAVLTTDPTKFLSATPALMNLLSLVKKIAKAAPVAYQSQSLQSLVEGMISLCQQKRWYTALRYTQLLIELKGFQLLEVFIKKSPCQEDETFFCGLFSQLEMAWVTGDASDQEEILQLTERIILRVGSNWRRAQEWIKLIASTMDQPAWKSIFSGNQHKLRVWKNKNYESRLNRFPTEMTKAQNLSAQLLESAWLECYEAQKFYADSRIQHYYTQRGLLEIKRLSGDLLEMECCYINLVIVEHSGDDTTKQSYSNNTERNPSAFTLFSRLKVKEPDTKPEVVLHRLFDKRGKLDGSLVRPKRILIRGRAGVGKTTLCKKIVHDFLYKEMWADDFDRVLWIPLRKLKGKSTLEQFFYEEYFSMHHERDILAPTLWKTICDQSDKKTLFILDGLDEVSGERNSAGIDLVESFKDLLNRPNVIITSRPYAVHLPVLEPFDLELETVGFHSEQVDIYLSKVVSDRDTAQEMQSFIQGHWLIQGLVQIPIQLDALCYSWDSDFSCRGAPETMTALYQAIELKLWTKDILQLGKPKDSPLSEYDLQYVSSTEIMSIIEDEDMLLQHLAFTGIYNDVIEFNVRHRNEVYKHYQSAAPFLSRNLVRLSFLRTADSSVREKDKSYHFLHLTFQEYFAAKYFVRCWKNRQELLCLDLSFTKQRPVIYITTEMFLQQEKYNGRYDIFWRFVSGLLQEQDEEQLYRLFEMLGSAPLDLLGPGHQRILMHCLSEVPLKPHFRNLRTGIESQLRQWTLFESRLDKKLELCREMEFPDHMLDTMLAEEANDVKEHIMKALKDRPQLSPFILHRVFSFLRPDTPILLTSSALYALGNQDIRLPENMLPVVLSRLHDPDIAVRQHAAVALYRRTLPEHVIQEILQKLKDTSADTRRSATNILYNQTLPDQILQVLVSQLNDPNMETKKLVSEILGSKYLPEHILRALMSQLDDTSADMRLCAVRILQNQRLSDDDFRKLLSRLKDPDSEVRGWTLYAMDKRILSVDMLRILLSQSRDINEDVTIRTTAFWAIAKQRGLPNSILQEMTCQLDDANMWVRQCVLEVFRNQLRILPGSVLKAVVFQLKDPDVNIRELAIYILCGPALPGNAIQEVVDQLLQLKGIDPDIRQEALYNLRVRSSILQGDFLQEMVSTLEDTDKYKRQRTLLRLADETHLSQHILQAVASRLEDNDKVTRRVAAEALSNQTILPEDILQALVSRLEDTDVDVRKFAVEAIAKQGTLPVHILQVLVHRLPRLLHYPRPEVEHILMKYDYFYVNFPHFDTEIQRLLYGSWVQRSFSEQISCYMHDGNLYINTPEGRRMISSSSDMGRVIRTFQNEAATSGNPVCSTSLQVVI